MFHSVGRLVPASYTAAALGAANMDDLAIWSLAIFIVVNVALILVVGFPISIPIWRTKISIPVSFAVPPVLGVVAMLCSRCISWKDVATAIQGNKAMQPYGIVVLFMSTAYMCTTLDITGIFAWLSLKFTHLSRGNGRLLFVTYFFLAGMITLVTSNDIVVMTLTPIVCHFAAATGADPVPFLTAQFSAANLWSMALLIGNPTNVIVGQAAGVGFVTYMKWMAVPTIVTAGVCLCALCVRFWHRIPARLNLPDIDPSRVLQDKTSAIFGTLNIMLCLGLMAASQYVGVQLWIISLANALLAVLFNTGIAMYRHFINPPASVIEKLNAKSGLHVAQKDHHSPHLAPSPEDLDLETSLQQDDLILPATHPSTHPPHQQQQPPHLEPHHPEPTLVDLPRTPFQTLRLGFTSLPWDVPPFVLAMFILVQGLAVNGWTDRMGELIGKASPGVMPALLVNSFIAIVLANVINNQPMTILMTKVLLGAAFDKQVGDDTKLAALFGLVAGSNLGANFTLIGALAGIMWCNILSRQHVPMSFFKFITLLAPFGVISTVTMCSMLWLQFYIF